MNDESRVLEVSVWKMASVIVVVAVSFIFGSLLAFLYLIALTQDSAVVPLIWFFILIGGSLGSGLLSMWFIGKKWGVSLKIRIARYIGFFIGLSLIIGFFLFTISTNQPPPLTKDGRRISTVKQYQLALELYFYDHNSYPKTLSELIPDYFPVLSVDPVTDIPYFYSFHISDSGKVDGYHMGANLDNRSSSAFDLDEDCNSISGFGCTFQSGYDSGTAFNGFDDQGCDEEAKKYCYDVSEKN